MVHRLREASSRLLLAVLVEDVDFNGPLLHRKALHLGRLVAIIPCQPNFHLPQMCSPRSVERELREKGVWIENDVHVVLFGDNFDLALYTQDSLATVVLHPLP